MSAPAARLAAVAAWDADALGSAVGLLHAVAEHLPVARSRLDALGRRLEEGTVWSGASSAACTDGVLVLCSAVSGVVTAVEDSLAACRQLTAEAAAAAELARAAVAPGTGEDGVFAAEALLHADRAAGAATRACEALAGPPLGRTAGPGAFLAPSVTSTPAAVAVWWAGMRAGERGALVRQHPVWIGSLDGLPAGARDRANRRLLARALRQPDPSATARAVAEVLDAHEAAGRTVQLHLFDEPGERVAVGLGDADSAEEVALLVPGVGTTPSDDLARMTAAAARTVASAEAAGADDVAAIAWLGYRPPRWAAILGRGRAEESGPVLDDALDGLAAARAAAGELAGRTTVLAHSYGTVVLDEAADAPGELAADAVVLLGSPGMEGDAADLEADEVYGAASPADLIAWSGWFGTEPGHPSYGAVELPVAPRSGHSDYYDRGGPTLAAMGAVVASGWPG